MTISEKIKLIFSIIFKKRLNLNPDEMAIRSVYEDLLKEKKLKTVFRPGERDCKKNRGYCESQVVKARVIEKTGADWAFVPPRFNGYKDDIMIKKIYVKKMRDLKEEDFFGTSPDIKDKESLRYHLGLIYNLPLRTLHDDFFVTIINFEYLNQ